VPTSRKRPLSRNRHVGVDGTVRDRKPDGSGWAVGAGIAGRSAEEGGAEEDARAGSRSVRRWSAAGTIVGAGRDRAISRITYSERARLSRTWVLGPLVPSWSRALPWILHAQTPFGRLSGSPAGLNPGSGSISREARTGNSRRRYDWSMITGRLWWVRYGARHR